MKVNLGTLPVHVPRSWIYLLLAGCLLAGQGGAAELKPAAWLDSAPLTRQSVILPWDGGAFVRVDVLGERLFRIRHSKTRQWTESGLNRYGVFSKTYPAVTFEQTEGNGVDTLTTRQAKLTLSRKDGTMTLATAAGKALTRQRAPIYETGGGYDLRFELTKDERIYGLGDSSRENMMRRGGVYEIWVRNVKAYIPIPVVLSSQGWGMLMNTTWRNRIDVGKSDPDRIVFTAPRSDVDFYLFCGPDYRALLDTYTSFSGRPALLPIWGYAFTYVCNQNVHAFEMMNEALTFRREDLPCDVIGLEPGWMSQNYDYSTAKQWHPERFAMPTWSSIGPQTFVSALKRRGFRLSLWLCCDYDLFDYEERQLAGVKPPTATRAKASGREGDPDDFEKDEHLTNPTGVKKKGGPRPVATPESEDWFQHLEKFVDQGVAAFKLDGSKQVLEHPTRQWGNGMNDEQMHNLYPVIYDKQMAHGFEKYANRRSMVYSAGGYAGVQQFTASWAGDTGGGPKPLVSMLNHGFSGHVNHSCDMDVFSIEGIHFGFLQTWTQLCNWAYWRQPWLLEDPQIAAFREYDKLRYKLLPYLYSTAANAALTGYPVMRALPMVYPDDPAWDACLTQYMLGDFFLVSVFAKEIRLPPGEWTDFWSGRRLSGPATLPVEITPTRGGALLVKSGAIIPTWPPCNHVEKGWSPEVGLLVYPAASSTFTLYEDDGNSLDYRRGQFAQTCLSCETSGKAVKLTIGGRVGRYAGMPPTRDFTATIQLPRRPQSVTLDGAAVKDYLWSDAASTATIKVPACGAAARVVECQ